jgi:hypothetical protein
VALDPDHVPGGCWVHEAIVGGQQVSPHHPDKVTAACACGRPVAAATQGLPLSARNV